MPTKFDDYETRPAPVRAVQVYRDNAEAVAKLIGATKYSIIKNVTTKDIAIEFRFEEGNRGNQDTLYVVPGSFLVDSDDRWGFRTFLPGQFAENYRPKTSV